MQRKLIQILQQSPVWDVLPPPCGMQSAKLVAGRRRDSQYGLEIAISGRLPVNH